LCDLADDLANGRAAALELIDPALAGIPGGPLEHMAVQLIDDMPRIRRVAGLLCRRHARRERD
jgi:hypothetical protein